MIGLFSIFGVMEPQENYMEELYGLGEYKHTWMLCCRGEQIHRVSTTDRVLTATDRHRQEDEWQAAQKFSSDKCRSVGRNILGKSKTDFPDPTSTDIQNEVVLIFVLNISIYLLYFLNKDCLVQLVKRMIFALWSWVRAPSRKLFVVFFIF